MKDRFEIFIRKSGEGVVETFQGKEITWERIDKKLHRRKTRKLYIRLGMAASISIMVGIGIISLKMNEKPKYVTEYYSGISRELSETEFYFANIIEEKEKEIENTGDYDKDFFQTYIDELNELDKQYESYKGEIENFGFQEELIRAMIENQQEKIELLNKFLSEIKKIKHYENRKKEYPI